MAQIVERLFSYVPAKALTLGGEQYARKIALGNQWTRIRMGALVSMSGSVTIQGAYFFMGLSAGQGGMGAVGSSAVGACLSGSTVSGAGAWTFTSNSGLPYFSSNASGKVFRRTAQFPGPFGASLASETSASITTVNIATNTGAQFLRRTPIIFDIIREIGGGGSATVTFYGMPTAAMSIDFRPDHLLEAIDNPGAPTVFGTAMSGLLSTTIPLSDMLGALDTFFIQWQRAQNPIEVYALGASISRPLAWEEGIGGAADSFSAYTFVGTAGTAIPSVLTLGSGFSGQGVFSGSYTNPGVFSGVSGTSGTPHDGFWNYATGSIVSGFTLSSGTGWAGNGVL